MPGASISIHPFYHLRERRFHSRRRARDRATEGACGTTGVPQVARCRGARTFPAQIVAVGKSPPTSSHPPYTVYNAGGNLCETRTPRPVRHRGKHEVIDGDTRPALSHALLSLAACARAIESRAEFVRTNACKSRVFVILHFPFFRFLCIFFFISFFLAPSRISRKRPARAKIGSAKSHRPPTARKTCIVPTW